MHQITVRLLVVGIFVLSLFASSFSDLSAAQLDNRSVRIGTSTPGSTTNYRFYFNVPTVTSVGSIEFEFCSNSPLVGNPCTPPNAFSALSASLASQSGETGFSIHPSSTINRIVLTRTASNTTIGPASYRFNNITNPVELSNPIGVGTFYVRVATFVSVDGTGARTDSGGLAFATTRGVTTEAYVPPYLTFCVGVTVAGDCSSASGNQLSFGEMSPSETKAVTSQFACATNDPTGYNASIKGLTMTSGTNTIPALSSPSVSQPGISQFGMNLRANSAPAVGLNKSGIGSASVRTDFNQPNLYTFKNAVIASSPYSTNFNVFTASYVVNVSSSQAPGVYNTTLTYIATAAF